MVSHWQFEVERRRRETIEREVENLELKRRTDLAESTVTHQPDQNDIDELFNATRDSSLATAHVRFIGKKSPLDLTKYIGFRTSSFLAWHLVHQLKRDIVARGFRTTSSQRTLLLL